MNKNIVILSVLCKNRFEGRKIKSYIHKNNYHSCDIKKITFTVNEVDECFTLADLEKSKKYFNKQNILISADGYFEFNLLFYEYKKLNIEVDLSDCYGSVCVKDLSLSLGVRYIPGNNTYNQYIKCISSKRFQQNKILSEISQHWINLDDTPRVVNEKTCKWIIFVQKKYLNEVWEFIKTKQNELEFYQARSSTSAVNIWGGSEERGVIELFYQTLDAKTYGFKFAEHCKDLKTFQIKKVVFKTDQHTKTGEGKCTVQTI